MLHIVRNIFNAIVFKFFGIDQAVIGCHKMSFGFSKKGAKVKQDGNVWYVDSLHTDHASFGVWEFSTLAKACRFASSLA